MTRAVNHVLSIFTDEGQLPRQSYVVKNIAAHFRPWRQPDTIEILIPGNRYGPILKNQDHLVLPMTAEKIDSPSLSVVVSQKTPKSPTTNHPSLPRADIFLRLDQAIVQSLMIPLSVIVSEVFPDGPSQHRFAEEKHAMEAFFLYGSHESIKL